MMDATLREEVEGGTAMNSSIRRSFVLSVWAGLAMAIGMFLGQSRSAVAQSDSVGSASIGRTHYTVVETDATNLIVTDNRSNLLYFYTIDRGTKPGAPLKLRGSVDLNQIGQASITPHRGK
jgi:hypothetical protein